jgi:hypothetical protein
LADFEVRGFSTATGILTSLRRLFAFVGVRTPDLCRIRHIASHVGI